MTSGVWQRGIRFRVSAIVLALPVLLIPLRTAAAGLSTDSAVKALKRRICFEAFWWGIREYRLGRTASITVRPSDGVGYIWSTELSEVPGVSRWADFFTVFSDGSATVIGSSYGYNIEIMQGNPEFERHKAKALGNGGETVRIRLPADCTPRFARDTPLKQRILHATEASMVQTLTQFNALGVRYPRHLRIVIANFDTDYREAEVFIPLTGEVFHVALMDPEDPLSRTYMEQGGFPVRPEYQPEAARILRGKIVKYGIVRGITLSGN